MKKYITFLVLTLFSITAFAQDTVPNQGFERWTSGSGYMDPTGWTTPNSITVGEGGVAEVTRTDTAFSGSYSARLETRQLLIPHVDTTNIPGFVLLGDINILGKSITGGVPFTGRPDTMYGFFRYVPANPTDSALVYVLLGDSINGSTDTVAFGGFLIGGTDTPWYKFSLPLTYFNTTQVPNYIQLVIASTDNFFYNPPLGSTFFIDSIAFSADTSTVTGIKTVTDKGFSATCYPNPANTNLNILISEPRPGMNIKVYDVLGRNLLVANNQGLITSINVSNLSTGTYFFEVLDANGNLLKTEKFDVVR